MAQSFCTILVIAMGCANIAIAQSMTDNLNFRASWPSVAMTTGSLANRDAVNGVVDLSYLKAGVSKQRSLDLAAGADRLLAVCLVDGVNWHRDKLVYRFGHSHPFSTIGCRERASPSLHVVFYQQPDGTRRASIHFDRYSPGNFPGHAAEVVQNRLTFGRTSQQEIYRHLVLRLGDLNLVVPPPAYDFQEHAREYWSNTFSPLPLGWSVVTGGVAGMIDQQGGRHCANDIVANLIRHVARQTIEFGTAATLKQDETFAVSGESGAGRRIAQALYHSFFVPGREGDEFAFPRVAAAFGTAYVLHEWRPWREERIGVTRESLSILSAYVARSFWHEFDPDVKQLLRAGKRKLESGGHQPKPPAQSPAA